MTTPIITAFIPETAIEALEKRLKQVNRQATKLGVEPIRYELTGCEEQRRTKNHEPFVFAGERIEFTERFVEVAVFGEQPKLPGGWMLLGVVDHREALPIVKCVPGNELPEGQRERGPVCDHCDAKRRRVDTFVLRAEGGRVVQVGRQCLGDFLGLSVNDPARQLAWWIGANGVLSGLDDGDYPGPRARPMVDVREATLVAAACVDEFGWVSRQRARADYDATATAARVQSLLFPPIFASRKDGEWWREMRDAVELRATDALKAEVEAALAWAAAHAASKSDYLLNLAACALSGQVGKDKLGLVTSLIAAYRREQERLVHAERKAKLGANSEHVGEVKQRLTRELTLLEKPHANEGAYGVTYRCELIDGDGNLFVWWASNDPTLEQNLGLVVGASAKVKATVKKHEEWKGSKRTVVTRLASA